MEENIECRASLTHSQQRPSSQRKSVSSKRFKQQEKKEQQQEPNLIVVVQNDLEVGEEDELDIGCTESNDIVGDWADCDEKKEEEKEEEEEEADRRNHKGQTTKDVSTKRRRYNDDDDDDDDDMDGNGTYDDEEEEECSDYSNNGNHNRGGRGPHNNNNYNTHSYNYKKTKRSHKRNPISNAVKKLQTRPPSFVRYTVMGLMAWTTEGPGPLAITFKLGGVSHNIYLDRQTQNWVVKSLQREHPHIYQADAISDLIIEERASVINIYQNSFNGKRQPLASFTKKPKKPHQTMEGY